MIFDDRQRADRLRDTPLETVLILWGGERDPRDKHKWNTEQGPLSITGQKFMSWHKQIGGGGAIDLVMHLGGLEPAAAMEWLERQCGVGHCPTGNILRRPTPASPAPPLQLPLPCVAMRYRVCQYLTRCRHLPAAVVDRLLESGKLYADRRANAVFMLTAGKAHRPVGAELRGTGPRRWRGMAPGSDRNAGYFWIGMKGSPEIVLCESAIDAISCWVLDAERICISTSGIRANPPWVRVLLTHGYRVHCGFDTDEAGETAAVRLRQLYPQITRLRPAAHDWNDALASTK